MYLTYFTKLLPRDISLKNLRATTSAFQHFLITNCGLPYVADNVDMYLDPAMYDIAEELIANSKLIILTDTMLVTEDRTIKAVYLYNTFTKEIVSTDKFYYIVSRDGSVITGLNLY